MELAFEIFKWVGFIVCTSCLLVGGLGLFGMLWQWMLKYFSPPQMYRASLILVGLHYHEKKNGMKDVSGYALGRMCRKIKKASPATWENFLGELRCQEIPDEQRQSADVLPAVIDQEDPPGIPK